MPQYKLRIEFWATADSWRWDEPWYRMRHW